METFEHLRRSRLVLLTSRGPGDVALHRPVRMSVDDAGNGSVWLPKGLRLVARLDACPEVRVAPCDLRARPTGSDQPAFAQRCEVPPAERASSGAIARETGLVALLGRLKQSFVCYRLTPADEPTHWQQRVAGSADASQ